MENTAVIPLGAKRDLYRLRLLYLLTGTAGGLFNPYLTTLLVHQKMNASIVGGMMSVGILLSIIVQPIWGVLVDRYRQTKGVLLLAIIIPAVLSFFYSFQIFAVIVFAYIISIIFSTTQSPIADSYAVSAARAAGTSYGTIRMLGSLGTALGGYAGGFYLSHFEITRLWLPFLLLSLAGAATVLSLSNNKREYAAAPVSLSEGLRELLGNRLFLLFLIACFFVNQTLTAYNSFFVLAFQEAGGSYSLVGTALLLASLTNVPSMLLAAKILKAWGHERTLLLAAFFYALRWAIQWLFPIPMVMVGIQVLHGLSFGLFYVAAVEYVAAAAGKRMQATGQSIFNMVFSGLGGIVGNLLNGFLFSSGGANVMYFACTISALIGAGMLYWINKMAKRVVVSH
ncbi:MFS transporter [Paenibacillus massiliensis]|uniref:MFS transporter n=1 Tax=Paenibacillus massiliensis TaxID=225917 RepID=UPI00041F675E|nr:MFS transporter [Paenibacillus massiliensis]